MDIDNLDWQNGYEALLQARTSLADTYIQLSPVPDKDKGHLVLEDNNATNYEIIRYTSKDAGGVYTTGTGARNLDGNSDGVHAKGARVRGNITAQDLVAMRNAVQYVVANYSAPTTSSVASAATITPDADVYTVSALATSAVVAAPTGTPIDGQVLVLRLKDNGTSQALSWNAIYSNVSGLDPLNATTINKWHIICCQYNSAATKWHIVSISTEA